MYIVIDPRDGTFVDAIEASDAISAVVTLWNRYTRNTAYKLYREVGKFAYEQAEKDLQLNNPDAKAASRA